MAESRADFAPKQAPEGWDYEKQGKPDILFWRYAGEEAAQAAKPTDVESLWKSNYEVAEEWRDTEIRKAEKENANKTVAEEKQPTNEHMVDKNGIMKEEMPIPDIDAGYQEVPKYISIIEGKVEAKIPVNEYIEIRKRSVKNKNAQSITLGKYTPTIENGIENWSKPGPDSYIALAGSDSSYFDMGNEWQWLEMQYDLTDQQMFEMFNKPFIDNAINSGVAIRFSHNPLDYEQGAIIAEWSYIKECLSLDDKALIKKGEYWYVKR